MLKKLIISHAGTAMKSGAVSENSVLMNKSATNKDLDRGNTEPTQLFFLTYTNTTAIHRISPAC